MCDSFLFIEEIPTVSVFEFKIVKLVKVMIISMIHNTNSTFSERLYFNSFREVYQSLL